MSHSKKDTYTRALPVAEGLSDYFSRRSRLIALEGPRGPLLARYVQTDPPDPSRHAFLTTFPADYPVFEGTSVPESAPPDVQAICWPVETSRDPRVSIVSGAQPALGDYTSPSARDVILSGGESLAQAGIAQQEGLRYGPGGMHAHFGGGGFSVIV